MDNAKIKTVQQKRKTMHRIGQSPVQFSVTVEQFATMFGATKLAHDKVQREWEDAGYTETAIVIHLTRAYPMSTLERVIMRDKIVRFIRLRNEVSKLDARNQTD